MAHVIYWLNTHGTAVLAARAGERFYVSGPVSPALRPLITCETVHGRTTEFQAAVDLLFVANDYDDETDQAHNLLYARRDRLPCEGIRLDFYARVVTFPRLRAALHAIERRQPDLVAGSRLHIAEGLAHGLAYRDEMILGDHKMGCTGSDGWLLSRRSIGSLLAAFPAFDFKYTIQEEAA